MAIDLPQLNYGTVIGRFLVELADSDDADLKPDVYPASGHIVFTPGAPYATVASASPDPATIFPQKVIGVLDSNGYLHQAKFNGPTGTYAKAIDGSYIPDTGVGVRLQATDDSDLNPTDWSWRADFYFNYNKTPINYPGFNFQLPSDKTIDLTMVKPVSESPGEYTIVGPQGPRGEIGDPGPATTIKIGTVTTKPTGTPAEATITGESPDQTLNFAFPQGPVGPSGGPIPAGGSAGDSVMRGTGTSSEWRFTDGIQDNIFPNGSLEYNNDFRWSKSMTNTALDAPPGFSSSMWCPTGASSFSASTNDLSPVVVGDDYIFEIWVKADKPNSKLYIEMRDQDGSHAGVWTWVEGGTNPANAYPIGQYTVPTEWTKIKARGKLNSTVTQIRVATFYFNHSSGTEREASVGLAGLRVYRAPSVSTVSSDLLDVLPSTSQKSLLNTATSSATANTLAQRDSSGSTSFKKATVTDLVPTVDGNLTSKKYVDDKVQTDTRIDLISNLKAPLIVAHRGGKNIYPEESMEGFIASMESGYVPEMDIQFLSDGTPALCHDSTVNRTMAGGTGNVSSFTRDQWRKMRILPAFADGKTAKPVLFEDVLDRIGGQVLLMPEIKTAATTAQVTQIINMVKSKRLEKAVILQTFTWATAVQIANAGLTPLFLFSSTTQSPADIKAAGIEFVGPSKSVSNTTMSAMASAGLKVIPYTLNKPAEVAAQPSTIFGYFSDDPWYTSGEMQGSHTGWWTEGIGWPARVITSADSGAGSSPYDGSSFVHLRGGGIYVPKDANMSLTHVGLDHLIGGTGLIERPLSITARFEITRRTSKESSTVGFTLIRNTINQDNIFKDTTNPGQNGYTVGVRRSGEAVIWRYLDGASAERIEENTSFWPGIPAGYSGSIVLTLDMSEGYLKLHGGGNSGWLTVKDEIQGPFRAYLRFGGVEATAYDVAVNPYINSDLN